MLSPAMASQHRSPLDNSLSNLNLEVTVVQVMELAQGGSLLDYVRQRKRLAEPEACFFLQQIVHGLMHCHDMEVCHVWPLKLSLSVLFLSRLPLQQDPAAMWSSCNLVVQSH